MRYMHRFIIKLVFVTVCAGSIWQIITPRVPIPLQLPAPSTVVTAFPKAGVHTRLAGVGDEQFIGRQLDLVAEMGTPWVVELFPWAYA